MNTKIKHRILGILVVIGLVIILLPLLQSGKETPSETTTIKAPPFPDQAAEVNSNSTIPKPNEPVTVQAENNVVQPDDTISNNRPIANAQTVELPKPDVLDNDKLKNVVNTVNETTEEVKNSDQSTSEEVAPVAVDEVSNQPKNIDKSEDQVVAAHKIKQAQVAILPIKKTTQAKHDRHPKLSPLPHDDNGLVKLKSAVWVIQIGNYSNKTKAIRVVNHLRSNGYSAFIQHVSTSFGNSTRVFVGPEYQQTAANQLADRLEKEIHIRGIVLSYKPLSM